MTEAAPAPAPQATEVATVEQVSTTTQVQSVPTTQLQSLPEEELTKLSVLHETVNGQPVDSVIDKPTEAQTTTQPQTSNDDGFVDFAKDNNIPQEIKEMFGNSKVSKDFFNKIQQISSPEAFTKDILNTYGDNAGNVLKGFREFSNDTFTKEEQQAINQLPSSVKLGYIKLFERAQREIDSLKKQYGVNNSYSPPKPTPQDYRNRFNEITKILMSNNNLTQDQYSNLNKERLAMASKLSNNNRR
ncbi:MAG: hypothetical protein LBH46_04365 [Rickettsiales bacterium]|jgi:hypothetical protein|nr:hypothetical protein [Rickettsiales bacterium]